MRYLSTMVLESPSYESFLRRYSKYKTEPKRSVIDFEAALCKFFDVDASSTFNNCFAAIAIALIYATSLRIKTVAIAGMAYRRTSDIVRWAGLEPVYVDNDPETLCMCPYQLERVLAANKVGAVLVQHPVVTICDPTLYVELCDAYQVPLIFDTVEATGQKYKGKMLGGFGIAEAFSLHPSKVINGAEGGVLTFGDKQEHKNFQNFLQSIGVINQNGNQILFGLEPTHAVLAMESLTIFESVREKLQKQYNKYKTILSSSSVYKIVEYQECSYPNYKSILVELPTNDKSFRANLLQYLESFQIGARPYYWPLHQLVSSANLPVAQAASEKYLLLPTGHTVTDRDIERICKKMSEFLELTK